MDISPKSLEFKTCRGFCIVAVTEISPKTSQPVISLSIYGLCIRVSTHKWRACTGQPPFRHGQTTPHSRPCGQFIIERNESFIFGCKIEIDSTWCRLLVRNHKLWSIIYALAARVPVCHMARECTRVTVMVTDSGSEEGSLSERCNRDTWGLALCVADGDDDGLL